MFAFLTFMRCALSVHHVHLALPIGHFIVIRDGGGVGSFNGGIKVISPLGGGRGILGLDHVHLDIALDLAGTTLGINVLLAPVSFKSWLATIIARTCLRGGRRSPEGSVLNTQLLRIGAAVLCVVVFLGTTALGTEEVRGLHHLDLRRSQITCTPSSLT